MTNDLINNMDELKAEHEAEKAVAEAKANAEQEAKDAAKRAEWQAREDEARIKRNAADAMIYERIAAKVTKPHVAVVDAEKGKLVIDGIDVTYYIEFKSEYTEISRWRSKPTGKMRISVGDYGSRTSFPQKKDGSHNYEEIARRLAMIARNKNAAAKADALRQANSAGLATLKAELFPNDKNGYCNVIAGSVDAQAPVLFKFDIYHNMSPDQARTLAAAMRAAGIKLHYSDEG